jgi:hypothetical protein
MKVSRSDMAPNYVVDRICGLTTQLDILYHMRYNGVNCPRRESKASHVR